MAKELKEIIKDIKVNQTWLKSLKHLVPLFIAEAKDNKPWDKWEEKIFEEFFVKGNNQCISSLRQGYFDRVVSKKK